MQLKAINAIDFYKADHRRQCPEGTTEIYSNFTPRKSRIPEIQEVVFFGLQYFIKDFLMNIWNNTFFNRPIDLAVFPYKRRMDNSLGKDAISMTHIEQLHQLGYLPIRIKALPEGEVVPTGIPLLTIVNTHPDFFWLTNYIETILSSYVWQPTTIATIAFQYKKLLLDYAQKTGTPVEFVNWQGHDFSFRGMPGPQAAAMGGAGHLTAFYGTDSVPAIDLLEKYYGANSDAYIVGGSVAATEHMVMSMYGFEGEFDAFKRLITEVYPTGVLSIVSDTYDFWRVVTVYLPKLKDIILKRDGKIVIRPDSGDPVKIICGDPDAVRFSPQYKGLIRCLWEIFGGTRVVGSDGAYCLLDSHIGAIYGDSITLERAETILKRLKEIGFASGNIVLGIGSFTYQMITRDTFGFAMKATSRVVNGERRDIFKDPKTDDGTKKSARGLLKVEKENGQYKLYQNVSVEEEKQGALESVFENGKLLKECFLPEIRARLINKLYGG